MKKYILYICLFSGFLAIAFFAGRCSTAKIRSQQIDNLIAARDSVKHYIIRVNGLDLQASEKDAIILSQEDAIKAGIIEKEYLKELHIKDLAANAQLKGEIKILRDSLDLPPGTVYITIKDTSGAYRDYVRIPFQLLKLHEKYLTLNAGIDSSKKAWFDLSTPVVGTMTIGSQKSGFMKTKPVGIFTSDNQYLSINSMDILIVRDNKRWYEKWWVHMLAGAAADEGLRYILKR